MLAWGEATGTDIVCALITDVAICHHNQCAQSPDSGEGLRLIQIILCAAVWAIPRENDRSIQGFSVSVSTVRSDQYALKGLAVHGLVPHDKTQDCRSVEVRLICTPLHFTYMAPFHCAVQNVRDAELRLLMYREVGTEIECQTTRMRDPVCSEKRLLVTLHWLSTGLRFKDLVDTWTIGTATAQRIVHQVVLVMDMFFSHRSIVFPVGRELEQVMTVFDKLSGLEQCGGAIDGTFVQIKRPSGEFGFRYW